MSTDNLFSNQIEVFDKIYKIITDNNDFILVKGKSGCGKSYLINYMRNSDAFCKEYSLIFIPGERFCDNRPYTPFNNMSYSGSSHSQQFAEIASVAAKDIPYGSNLIQYFGKVLLKKNNIFYKRLNKIEQELVAKLGHITKNGKSIIFIDNLHYWDESSLYLLGIIFTYDNYIIRNTKIVAFITTDQIDYKNKKLLELMAKFFKKIINFRKLSFLDFCTFFDKEELLERTTLSDRKILYELINSNIQILIEIVLEIKENRFNFNSQNKDSVVYLGRILKNRLASIGIDGSNISSTLEYASLIGSVFSSHEIQRVMNMSSTEFEKVINNSNSLRLTKQHDEKHIRFAHELIRNLFDIKIGENKVQYYKNLEKCIATIKPGEYIRRLNYLLLSNNNKKAGTIYALACIKDLTSYEVISPNIKKLGRNIILEGSIIEYIFKMQEAYNNFNKKLFFEAIDILDTIENLYPKELIAEKFILLSQCKTRSLNETDRKSAVLQLMEFDSLEKVNFEIEVYEMILFRLMSSNSHLGNLDEARKYESRLYQSLITRCDFDVKAMDMINILRSRSDMYHNCTSTLINTEKAYDYFKPKTNSGIPQNLRQLYFSITNYSGALSFNGRFESAYKITLEGLILEKEYPGYDFVRKQILYNNYAISGYLSGKLNLSKSIKVMCDIIKSSPQIAERLTYISNLSVFYAIDGDVERAKKILFKEYTLQNVKWDPEGFYKYRAETNLILYDFLSQINNNYKRRLEKLYPIIEKLNNKSFYLKRNNELIKLLSKGFMISAEDFTYELIRQCPSFQGEPWNFFGLTYAFAPQYSYSV